MHYNLLLEANMKVKDQVLKQLEDNKGTYFSGSELAAALGVSRNAVWKAIKSLEKSGYRISAVPNKGYCLNMDNDILSSWSIKQHLNHDDLNITVYDTISSTNDVLKEQAAQGAPHGTVIISQEQTAGKGRMGKNFYSPSKNRLLLLETGRFITFSVFSYQSVLLHWYPHSP